MFRVSIISGSVPEYRVNFGDETKPNYLTSSYLDFGENSTRNRPNESDVHYIDYIYDHPGNYVVSVEVKNMFGNVHANLSHEIIVQNPLQGSKYILKPDQVKPVPYPPGFASISARLMKDDSFNFHPHEINGSLGWANDVHVTWIHAKTSENVILQYSFGVHEIGEQLLLYYYFLKSKFDVLKIITSLLFQ